MSAVRQLLEQERVDLYVSPSSLRVLSECPREWWYSKVEGVAPEDKSARLVLGSALHEALGAFYRALMNAEEAPGGEELLGIAHAAVRRELSSGPPILFGDDEDAGDLLEQAERLLNAFGASGLRPKRVLAVEMPFTLPLSDPETSKVPYEEQVAGAFDLVVEDDDGSVVVVDHKSAARSDKEKGARPDIQMGLYAWAAEQVFGVETVGLRYQNLIKTKVPKVEVQEVRRTIGDELEAIEAVEGALELIHVAVAHPNGKRLMGRRRSWRCHECSFRRRCAGDRT